MNIEKTFLTHFKQYSKVQLIFCALVLIVIGVNSTKLTNYVRKILKVRQVIPYQFPGQKFSGIDGILQNSRYVSYLTDKDLKEQEALMQFSQAQYILAPVILDPENLNHEFVLIDCSTKKIAISKLKESGLVPLKMNQFGIILARNIK